MAAHCPFNLAAYLLSVASLTAGAHGQTFSDANWESLGVGGFNNVVRAAVVDDSGRLFVGGDFTTVDGISANRVAMWNGSSWSALGLGMNHRVYALAVSGTNLYAGGDFTSAGGNTANRVAKWDGSAWSSLGMGLDSSVFALAVVDSVVFAGGRFEFAIGRPGYPLGKVAKWGGVIWSSMSSGVAGQAPTVYALTAIGTDLFVGGDFTIAGGYAASGIAKWDGRWSALGSGVSGTVFAFATSGTNLFVGGSFTNAGGIAANRIAKWDGNAWSSLGAGMDSWVQALTVAGTNLYAGGTFNMAGLNPASRIAKWDSSAWSPMGSGLNNNVYALAFDNWNLYTGGTFSRAGNKPSGYAAVAYTGPAPGRFTNIVNSLGTGFKSVFVGGTTGFSYRIQTSSALSGGNWADLTNFTYGGATTITTPTDSTNRFFRAVTP